MYHMNLLGRGLSEPCSRCREPSVLFQRYSGRHLCATHLAADILIRTKRTIRIQGGLGKKPVLSIIWDGSADICSSTFLDVSLGIVRIWNLSFFISTPDVITRTPHPIRYHYLPESPSGRNICNMSILRKSLPVLVQIGLCRHVLLMMKRNRSYLRYYPETVVLSYVLIRPFRYPVLLL